MVCVEALADRCCAWFLQHSDGSYPINPDYVAGSDLFGSLNDRGSAFDETQRTAFFCEGNPLGKRTHLNRTAPAYYIT